MVTSSSDSAASPPDADAVAESAGTYWQLEFPLSAANMDDVEDLLWAAQALSVSAIPDARAPDLFEPDPGATPLWQQLHVLALFADVVAAESARATLSTQLADPPTFQLGCVVEADWQHAWRQHVRPICLDGQLWICPTGARTPEMGANVVLLDAGLAFGTGAHATTSLCLEWLAREAVSTPDVKSALAGARVIDFGCGSGILGIAALVLGAASVQALDHDPQARRATHDNAVNNGVSERLRLSGAEQLRAESADVLLANILAGTLIELSPLLGSLVTVGGRLLLSGVLSAQADGVMAAYPEFEFAPPLQRDDWVCLYGRRRAGGFVRPGLAA